MRKNLLFLIAVIVTLSLSGMPAHALDETADSSSAGFDATDLITVGASILALILGIMSFIAYRRDGRAKLLFVALAFSIFAFKGVLILGSDILSLQKPTLDIIANLLDFIVLLFFFTGMIKR